MTSAYEAEQSKYDNNKIKNIELTAENKQYSIAWTIVNEISGRKNSNSAKLKASNNGEISNYGITISNNCSEVYLT